MLLVASKFLLRFPQTHPDAEAVVDPPTAPSGSAQSWEHQGFCKHYWLCLGSTVKSVKASGEAVSRVLGAAETHQWKGQGTPASQSKPRVSKETAAPTDGEEGSWHPPTTGFMAVALIPWPTRRSSGRRLRSRGGWRGRRVAGEWSRTTAEAQPPERPLSPPQESREQQHSPFLLVDG